MDVSNTAGSPVQVAIFGVVALYAATLFAVFVVAFFVELNRKQGE